MGVAGFTPGKPDARSFGEFYRGDEPHCTEVVS